MTLALIAGQGGLPPRLVRSLLAQGEVPLICEIEQFPSDIQQGELPRIGITLERFGTFLAILRDKGVTRLCMAGAVKRPPVDPSKIDAATLPLVPRVMAALAKGDDGTLRVFIDIFEEQGFEVIGASDIDATLLPPRGVLTQTAVLDTTEHDIDAAKIALAEMGQADLGQSVVVRQGHIIAREAEAGTDAMLASLVSGSSGGSFSDDPFEMVGQALDGIADWLSGPEAETARKTSESKGGILYKAPKPGQELRVDMPLIGVQTALRAAEAGLAGIVVQADAVMVLDLPEVLRVLDGQNMFLWVYGPAGEAG